MLTVDEIHDAVIPLAEQYGLERVFLFGSYARGDATEKSDVDFRIDRGEMRGFQFGGLYEDMKEALQKDVDIMTTKQLDKKFLSEISGEEILIYDRNGKKSSTPGSHPSLL